jgi:uncharacterized protein (DUF302 family)
MGKNITVFTLGLLAGIFIAFLAIFIVLPRQMFVVTESHYDFDDTVSVLVKSAEASEWTIPHQYNLQATMQKNGFETAPVSVMSMCNPYHAEKILNSRNSRLVSAIMPCRIAVYENDGKTYAAMLNAKLFYPFMKKEAKGTLKAANDESKQIIKTLKN